MKIICFQILVEGRTIKLTHVCKVNLAAIFFNYRAANFANLVFSESFRNEAEKTRMRSWFLPAYFLLFVHFNYYF